MLVLKDYGYRQCISYKRSEKSNYVSSFHLEECKDRFEIWNLITKERYRNKGNAERMLREFIEQFDFRKPLILYVLKENENAIRLYKKVGFKILEENHIRSDYAYKMQYQGGIYEN